MKQCTYTLCIYSLHSHIVYNVIIFRKMTRRLCRSLLLYISVVVGFLTLHKTAIHKMKWKRKGKLSTKQKKKAKTNNNIFIKVIILLKKKLSKESKVEVPKRNLNTYILYYIYFIYLFFCWRCRSVEFLPHLFCAYSA